MVSLLYYYQPESKATSDVVFYESYFDTVTFTLRFRRKPLHYMINLIVPCGLLSFIAVVTFLLPPGCTERLGLGE